MPRWGLTSLMSVFFCSRRYRGLSVYKLSLINCLKSLIVIVRVMNMYQEERLAKMIELLSEKKSLSNQDVMEALGISRDTARRDIIQLEKMGCAIRTHGGITVNDLNLEILSYKERLSENHPAKEKIAKCGLAYLKEKQLCYFDVSTTIELLCARVPQKTEAYTNSLRNLIALQKSDCGIHLLGGKLNRPNPFFYGSETLEQVEKVHFDVAFLGAASIHENGIYVEDEEDAGVKRKVIQHCKTVCVLADHSKFYKRSKYLAAHLNQIDILITDHVPPEKMAERINKAGVRLEVANE